MLHMLVNTHSEESCAFRSDENREALVGAFNRLEEVAEQQGVTLQGAWVNMGSHTVFALVEAPDAHRVDVILREAGLVGRTTSEVFAIMPMERAIEEVTR